jgi:hypothetical protein
MSIIPFYPFYLARIESWERMKNVSVVEITIHRLYFKIHKYDFIVQIAIQSPHM